MDNVELKLERIRLLEEKSKRREGLPFLYGWKWYKWAREFFESTNRITLLVAGNQLSKSSSQIRKCIDWATNKEKWPLLWRDTPRMFWYFYPSLDVALTEFETKWVPEFMPRNEFKEHPQYGWHFDKKRMMIRFNTGVCVFFKSYEQSAANLQTATLHALFVDEELPEHLYSELLLRTHATQGYFNMVFTATLGQDFWRRAMECIGTPDESLPDAHKIHASAYDCLFYEDGTASHWTEERIEILKRSCKSHNEILKRVYGRFVVDEGLMYPTYDSQRHRSDPSPIPKDWKIFAGVDIGSGGQHAHPAAIVFVAVNAQYTLGKVIRAWRGDGIVTTATDILDKYRELRQGLRVERAFYDWASADFGTIAGRSGEPFERAEKKAEIGEPMLNALFKNMALTLDRGSLEIDKIDVEFCSLRQHMDKRKAKDDGVDATRYAISKLPWDWVAITGQSVYEEKNTATGGVEMLLRNKLITKEELEAELNPYGDVDKELSFWDSQYTH